MIIGQKELLEQLNTMQVNFPRFSIIQGGRGAGKTMLAKKISAMLNGVPVMVEGKVDSIREVIELSYKQSDTTVYIIPNAGKMSLSAKNALLKVTEEPPKKAHFIMCLEDVSETLPTLTSRGTVFKINAYSLEELLEYADKVLNCNTFSPQEIEVIAHVCKTPLDVKQLVEYGVLDFNDYVEKVLDNINIVNGANAFKIGSKISFKKDDGLWDMEMFLTAVLSSYAMRMFMDNNYKTEYLNSLAVTSKYLKECRIKGVNKQATFDMWILDIRKAWR